MKFGSKIKNSLMNFSKPFPSDKDLRRSLIEMNKWKAYKQGLTKSVRAEKHNRTYSIDQQWRQPWNIPAKRGDMKIHNPFDKDSQSRRIIDPFEGNEGGLGQNMAMD